MKLSQFIPEIKIHPIGYINISTDSEFLRYIENNFDIFMNWLNSQKEVIRYTGISLKSVKYKSEFIGLNEFTGEVEIIVPFENDPNIKDENFKGWLYLSIEPEDEEGVSRKDNSDFILKYKNLTIYGVFQEL